jgi:hypothetical protein
VARNRPVSEKAPVSWATAKYCMGGKNKVSANIVFRTGFLWFRISATDGIICAVLERIILQNELSTMNATLSK